MPEDETAIARPLSIKRQRFAEGIAEGKSGPQALIEAGYRPSNANSASVMAHKLRHVPDVRAAIDEIRMRHINGVDRAFEELLDIGCDKEAPHRDRAFALDKYLTRMGCDARQDKGVTNNNVKIGQLINKHLGK